MLIKSPTTEMFHKILETYNLIKITRSKIWTLRKYYVFFCSAKRHKYINLKTLKVHNFKNCKIVKPTQMPKMHRCKTETDAKKTQMQNRHTYSSYLWHLWNKKPGVRMPTVVCYLALTLFFVYIQLQLDRNLFLWLIHPQNDQSLGFFSQGLTLKFS